MTINEKEINKLANVPTFIFDLDGTLADISKRLEISNRSGSMDWGEFFNPDNIHWDEPKQSVIDMTHLLPHQIVIFSGRSDTTRKETLLWLAEQDVRFDAILMRPMDTDEFTNDAVLKERWLNQLVDGKLGGKITTIKGVFDDRNQVVKMCRDKGLTCFQGAEGNF